MTPGDSRPEVRRPDRLTVEVAESSFATAHRPERAAALARLLLGPYLEGDNLDDDHHHHSAA